MSESVPTEILDRWATQVVRARGAMFAALAAFNQGQQEIVGPKLGEAIAHLEVLLGLKTFGDPK